MNDEKQSEINENDIAIVGIGLRFPGARTPDTFWENLCDGVESVTFHDEKSLLAAGVSAKALANPHYIRAGVVLEGMDEFDPEFFGLGPKEGAIMDPQHRQFLSASWEALEDAGHPPETFDGSIGVFAGCGMAAYFPFNVLTNEDLLASQGFFLLRHTGNDKDFLSTRLSYALNLTGPSMSVQTACSTSLVATHIACQSLLNFECDLALAGGVTVDIPHGRGYFFKEGEILSPDGHCRPFDHRARGTIFGSGAGVVVLRRLEDALEGGDRIYAVVKGSAINNDGSGKVSYLAPSVDGQAAAVVEALEVAGLDADAISYVECHGTGTAVGDPIEVTALTRAFRETTEDQGYCALASLKSNIGHLDTAAGIASLIKVSLSLYHEKIPASLNYEKPNPAIDFSASPFYVNDKLRDWPRSDTPRRAGINSLGVGGTNAHLILEEAPQPRESLANKGEWHVMHLSARSRSTLDQTCNRLAAFFRTNPQVNLADVAQTLRIGRHAFEHRRVFACQEPEEAAELLEKRDPRRLFTHQAGPSEAPVVFLLPGGGVQYADMSAGLYKTERTFREWVDRGLKHLSTLVKEDLRSLLYPVPEAKEEAEEKLKRPSLQLPLLFLVEYALAKLWQERGVEPEALLGHSLGENTAGCLAEVFSFEDGLGLVALRGRLFETLPTGGMLSIAISVAALEPLLPPGLDLAVVNGAEAAVVSGPVEPLNQFAAVLEEREIEFRHIPITVAAHSRMLDSILAEFGAYLRKIRLLPPKIPILSNRSGTWLTESEATDPDYWVGHLRQTVRFDKCLDTLLAREGKILLEVGPGQVLSSLARGHAGSKQARGFIPSLRHRDDPIADNVYFLTSYGRLWACGNPSNTEEAPRHHISLPTYPFSERSYWIEPVAPKVSAAPEPELKRLDRDDWFYVPEWKQTSSTSGGTDALETWLVFQDEIGIGKRLIERLTQAGHQVVSVKEGDSFRQDSDKSYVLSPEKGDPQYASLIRELVNNGLAPTRVLHLWGLTGDESFRPGSSFFHRNQERGFYSLFFLAKALAEESPSTDIHYIIMANGLFQLEHEGVIYPEKATILGPSKVIPREFPGATCVVADVQAPAIRTDLLGRKKLPAIPDQLINDLYGELKAKPWNACLLLRDKHRYLRSYRKWTPKDASEATPLRAGGTYLITGGLGGLGMALATYLAKSHSANLVLVGRTQWPAREDWEAWLTGHAAENRVCVGIRQVKELESMGGQVLVQTADVTDLEGMGAVVAKSRAHFGEIHGVFHVAGLIEDAPIQVKNQSVIEAVFGPKLHGTLVLDQLFSSIKLDFIVLYSSTSTVASLAGQVDYVAANEFLNAYARGKNGRRGKARVLSVAWGPWNEVGMASNLLDKMQRGAGATPQPSSIDHPILQMNTTDAYAFSVLSGQISAKMHWVLDGHRTAKGQAVLPGTGYLELARAALKVQGETRPFEVRDLVFMRPLFVGDEEEKTLRVKLLPEQDGYRFTIQSAYRHPNARLGWQTHAESGLMPCGPSTTKLDTVAEILARCTRSSAKDPEGIRTGQWRHMHFGDRWKVLREIHLGDGEAMALLELPQAFHGEEKHFTLHPAMLDMATGYPMDLIQGYDADEGLWVPLSYKSVHMYADLPKKCWSWAQTKGQLSAEGGVALFDITIMTEDGSIVLEIEGFAIKKLGGEGFSMPAPPLPVELELDPEISDGTQPLGEAGQRLRNMVAMGIKPDEGPAVLATLLRSNPGSEVVATPIDLETLRAQSEVEVKVDGPARNLFSRPELDGEYAAPENEIERTLVDLWQEMLGIEGIGVEDSFFELGGHSLIAVRLFARVKQVYHVEFPMSILFEAPTVRLYAEMISEATKQDEDGATPEVRKRHTHLVAMHTGKPGPKTPFFLVAGMFGNVLNLRHLAHLIATDRPFYGLQARGLYGDDEPHRRFEDMATDYIAEIRTVQKRGPYLLGGFSGGGITAIEMARQLFEAGEEVSLLALLDTPLPMRPTLQRTDKLKIHFQRLREDKLSYIWEWARNRIAWELKQRGYGEDVLHREESGTGEFHSKEIEMGFREACEHYKTPNLPCKLTLFRPFLDKRFKVGPDRWVSSEKEFVFADNAWAPYCKEVEIHEVPGDHDGMVLEPNVRALASHLADCIMRSEAGT